MEFEFDPAKSASNKDKHGIEFIEAQELWRDEDAIDLDADDKEEPRIMVIGRINEKHWSAIIVHRANRVRIISVRRSRKQEVQLYESQRSG